MTWERWTVTIAIPVVVILSAFVIKRVVPERNLGSWANVSGIVGGLATAISLLLATYTYFESARLQRELAAAGIYQEHMKISMETSGSGGSKLFGQYSDLALMEPPTKNSTVEEKRKYEPYRWYVGHALFSFESIFEVSSEDEWRETFAGFVCSHEKYMRSEQYEPKRYTKQLNDLVKNILQNGCEKYR